MGSLNLWGQRNSFGVQATAVGCVIPAQGDTGYLYTEEAQKNT